jgi:hypothetical protein
VNTHKVSKGHVMMVMIARSAEHELWMSRRMLREGLRMSVNDLDTGKIIQDETVNRIAVMSDLK